jgi:integrase
LNPSKSQLAVWLFHRYCLRCNFGRKITIHSLRHTATVHWLLAGVYMFTISRILGHSSVKVTETVYAHVPVEHKREAMDKLPF